MHPERLCIRAPSSRYLFNAILYKFELKFHKKSKDGSGKCNAYYTGNDNDYVMGGVFEILDQEKDALDKAEGLGFGYVAFKVRVFHNSTAYKTLTYIASSEAIDDNLRPYSWYKEFVVQGAKYLRLPKEYVSEIEKMEYWEDPNRDRVKDNLNILKKLNFT